MCGAIRKQGTGTGLPVLRVAVGSPAVRAGRAVSRVRNGGAAAQVGLGPGDLILQVGGEEISTNDEFAHGVMLAIQRGAFPMLVQRGRRGYYSTLPIKSRTI